MKSIATPLVAAPTTQLSIWRGRLLIAIVIAYIGFLIITPLVALTAGAFKEGLGAVITAVSQPDVLASFWRTLLVSLIVVIVHAIFGTIVAWVMVRHRFPGRELFNGLIDMPFAVSPVVAGYMLL